MSNEPIFLQHGEGKILSVMGIDIIIKARKEQTNGKWSLIEYHAPANFPGPPPHYHKIMDESFYVLEGTLTYNLNGETITGGPGSFTRIPPGTVHTFSITSDVPAKFLIHLSPGGFEGYFEEVVELFKEEGKWPPSDMSKLTALFGKYDTYSPGN